ncbi:hypothetical protein [Aeromicrobium yanjiei]|uniref:Uncharacterized protein n=1 Tax=Aeromicrobium yanjiei TaxID=2662028 RepID=A0A5Q2MBE0_9ACTN|nr:hypothetical protein [Aeromicrobium yanjiei]QGG39888.1 hypothetical protein GEV26_00015 [Aeromicrobium yanjiei]
MKQDGKWVDIDYTLREAPDGTYKPEAVFGDVRVSGGGTREVARVTFGDGDAMALTWPVPLGRPTVRGGTATYAVSETSDLVVTVTASGVATHLRLNSPPSSDDPTFKFGVETTHLNVDEAAGGLLVTDRSDTHLGNTSTLVAWDARRDAAGDPTNVVRLNAELSRARSSGGSSQQTLDLKAPRGFLSDPATGYPVTIDPDINAVNELRDTYTRPGDTVPTGQSPHLIVGRVGGDTTNVNPAVTLIQWENTFLAGKTISAASMNFYQYFTGSCSPRQINIHPLTAEFHETTTVNSNKPATNNNTGSSTLFTANRGSGCADGPGFVSASTLGLARAWSKGPDAGGLPNWGVQLNVPSADSGDASFERRFCSEEPSNDTSLACSVADRVPFMKFTYSDPAPATPPTPVVTASGLTRTLATTVTGVVKGNVRARFLVKRGSATVSDSYSAFVPSGTLASLDLPALPAGTYTVQAWANDGAQSSTAPSSAETFQVSPQEGLSAIAFTGEENPYTASAVVSGTPGASVRVRFAVKKGASVLFDGYSAFATVPSSGQTPPLTLPLPALALGNYDLVASVYSPSGPLGQPVQVPALADGPPGGSVVPIAQLEAYNTQAAGQSAVGPDESRVIPIWGSGGVPDDASVATITARVRLRNWTASGALQFVDPDSASSPENTSVNFNAGVGDASGGLTQTISVRLSPAGDLVVKNTSGSSVHLQIVPLSYVVLPDDTSADSEPEALDDSDYMWPDGDEPPPAPGDQQEPPMGTLGNDVFFTKGDRVHGVGYASGHGWWLTADPSIINKKAWVTIELQQYNLSELKWKTKDTGRKKVKQGGGSSRRANARRDCKKTNAGVPWRTRIDVDIIGVGDTPNKLTTAVTILSCKV